MAGRYATALFDLAEDQDNLDAVANDLDALDAMLAESGELRSAIGNPALSRDSIAQAVTTLAERAGFQEITRKFLGVVAEQRRMNVIAEIIAAFRAAVAEKRGEMTVEVITAQPLSDEMAAELKNTLNAYAGKDVHIQSSVDPRLLGGLVVRMGSQMIDASMRTKLNNLEVAMKGVG